MTADEFAALFPRLNALPLPPRPVEEKVDRSIRAADHTPPPRPAAKQITVWDEANTKVEITPEEET